ncbi:MAG: sulfatase [Isosphaeraceae bacterium]
MSTPTAISEQTSPAGSSSLALDANRPGVMAFLILSAWCGLVSGLLDVGTLILRKQFFDLNRLYWMSHHFIWLIPLTNLGIFLVAGMVLFLLGRSGHHRARWIAPRLLAALTLLPPLWAASTRIYGPAGLLLALGASSRLVPALERHADGFRRLIRISFPVVAGFVAILAASLLGADRIREWREDARPMPPTGSPNVLLIVLDTVAADHLSLYGYERPTSATMEELAARGVRFDWVQATSSWTLPSHASMLTGYWPHELSVGWITPLDAARPTLAEFLGSRGYATAGFAANYWYCARDSGLDRGFAAYRDYIFPRLSALKAADLVHRPVDGLIAIDGFLENRFDLDILKPLVQSLWWLFKADRKGAEVVNREFLDWLSRRRQPERPFFAFLNFYDAHHPYQLSEGGLHRFGAQPGDERESDPMDDGAPVQGRPSGSQVLIDRDSYDNCIADLDEQLGRLMDELGRLGILANTWVIVAADHGESFGEHPGVYRHGTSLYQSELHVPLLILPPARGVGPSGRVVEVTVSLRELPATIVDVAGLRADSPFPGESLARFWGGSSPASNPERDRALSVVVPLDSLNPDPAQLFLPRWPLAALTEGDWTYIRREGEVREELYHTRDDRQEQHDLAADPTRRSTLEHMRDALGRLTNGPLTPQRLKP